MGLYFILSCNFSHYLRSHRFYLGIHIIPYNGCMYRKSFHGGTLSVFSLLLRVFKLLPVFKHFKQLLRTLTLILACATRIKTAGCEIAGLTGISIELCTSTNDECKCPVSPCSLLILNSAKSLKTTRISPERGYLTLICLSVIYPTHFLNSQLLIS